MNLVWLRTDLRLEDNPALYHASQSGPTGCIYTITPEQWQRHHDAPAKLALWRDRLIQIQQELAAYNIPLIILKHPGYQGLPKALLAIAQKHHINAIYFNHEYPLNEKQRDLATITCFEQHGLETYSFHGDVVMPPGSVTTQQGAVYRVFTPFSRQWHKQVSDSEMALLPPPKKQTHQPFPSDDINRAWPDAPSYRSDIWPVQSSEILKKATSFCAHKVADYKEQRDLPSINGTSTLSPYLAMGAISVRQCLAMVRAQQPQQPEWRSNQWVTELIWREFYRHLIDHYPHLSQSHNFISMPNPIQWVDNEAIFDAWCQGNTGFPIVDAAMKQLQQTGWMHNRLRMITASFLSKLLLIDWRRGEQFFMQHLLDGDYASNNGGWQWSASTGADAAPYFRIFNPARQSERFDKEGSFIKKFLPELGSLDRKSIHTPSTEQRKACGYCEPIVDYAFARQRALDTFAYAMGKAD